MRCAEYATFGTQALADNAVAALRGRKAVLLANHGVIAVGATLDGAHAIAAEVENLATQYLALLAAGLKPAILGKAEMKRVAEKVRGLREGRVRPAQMSAAGTHALTWAMNA